MRGYAPGACQNPSHRKPASSDCCSCLLAPANPGGKLRGANGSGRTSQRSRFKQCAQTTRGSANLWYRYKVGQQKVSRHAATSFLRLDPKRPNHLTSGLFLPWPLPDRDLSWVTFKSSHGAIRRTVAGPSVICHVRDLGGFNDLAVTGCCIHPPASSYGLTTVSFYLWEHRPRRVSSCAGHDAGFSMPSHSPVNSRP